MSPYNRSTCLGVLALACAILHAPSARAQEPSVRPVPPDVGEPLKLTQLSQSGAVWIDAERKVVVVKGRISLREGPLEMFACPRQTKEHESIVAVDCRAYEVHTALLAIGLQPGKPMKYDGAYQPASGPRVDVRVAWRVGNKVRTAQAQEWIRHVETQKAMTHDWVFAGSGFWVDEETGEKIYYAEGGELICVSNFPTAMLDIPVASPDENSALWFEPFTSRIPPLGTEVYLLLRAK